MALQRVEIFRIDHFDLNARFEGKCECFIILYSFIQLEIFSVRLRTLFTSVYNIHKITSPLKFNLVIVAF